MCGIVGFRSQHHFDQLKASLEEATDRLHHRGPDDAGTYVDHEAKLGLGHRRLSIIDLSSAGHQPMQSHDGQYVITYNGEIYNFKSIRNDLEQLGHTFQSATDTEVILAAYQQWGVDCLKRFVGMFAFAIWDKAEKRLFLARDRIGIKPLYYHLKDGSIMFASELKALMVFDEFERDVDPEAIPLFLHYNYIPAPKTIFKNTYKLLPGSYLTFSDGQAKTEQYWHLSKNRTSSVDRCVNTAECVDELDSLLTEAVSDRLISDVPLGALLSGGIDSSLVVALMQKQSRIPVRTFSIGFEEGDYNEAHWASRVARHLGTDHTEFYVSPKEALNVIPSLPDMYDEPFADASAVPTYLVSRLTRSRVTVALSGDGGDEQFAGYVRYWSTREMHRAFQYLPLQTRQLAYNLCKRIPHSLMANGYRYAREWLPRRFRVANFIEKWNKLINLMKEDQVSELFRSTVCVWSKDELARLIRTPLTVSRFEAAFDTAAAWPMLSQLMFVDQNTYLQDDMLTKVDRASMAVGLEVRVPLLDHRVLEYSCKLPENMKYHNGNGKYLLKKLLSRYVPETLYERPKMGFGVPIESWFRNELKPLLMDYLSLDHLKREGLFDCTTVQTMIMEHMSGKTNHQYRLWALLMWEMWRERWLE
jgi:asparagine synthase (glutamine-hydrolysing)